MLRFLQVCSILIVIALLCSCPFLFMCIAGAIEGTLETYPVTQEQLEKSRAIYTFMICVIVFFDSVLAVLLAFIRRFINKMKGSKKHKEIKV